MQENDHKQDDKLSESPLARVSQIPQEYSRSAIFVKVSDTEIVRLGYLSGRRTDILRKYYKSSEFAPDGIRADFFPNYNLKLF